ncbi:SAM-dependent DNA methyltransferase [Vibrio fluvialis]|nr:SAM-dependent DNA methyltransferase [Vibrio fluvialis]MBY8053577.1 SAM-dependent DNA methyltransferase [Vibrio fluvialis]
MRQALDKTLRKKLEDTVVKARDIVEKAVFEALQRLGVAEAQAPSYLSEEERVLRNTLRAHARQLGDKLKDGKQETERLINEMAYEHWHRMLFARYLEQNNLLMYDEYTPVTLDECFELAEEEPDCKDGWELAGRLAQKMLPQIFRVDSPVFDIKLSMNRVEELESLIAQLDPQTYQAQDSLGWCYQFWQTKKKDQVNKSGVKIGAQELSPVTQLFTEPYMVSFLLDNALGAWWANKRLSQDDLVRANNEQELRELAAIPGVPLEYLRFSKDEDAGLWKPAAGGFKKWPEHLSELKTLDPCCGSGHFLVAVFLMLVPMRMQLEGLSEKQAVDAVLRDNIHGLELDQRCVEVAVFAVALEAWRYPNAGGYRQIPTLNIACCGVDLSQNKEFVEKVQFICEDFSKIVQGTKDSPYIGSLLSPFALAESSTLEKFVNAFEQEQSDSLSIRASGMVSSIRHLMSKYDLIMTNPPYLMKGKQHPILQQFCSRFFPEGEADLATVFYKKYHILLNEGGCHLSVTPLNWLFLKSYKDLRLNLLEKHTLKHVAKIGSGATAKDSWDVLRALTIFSTDKSSSNDQVSGLDVRSTSERDRAEELKSNKLNQSTVKSIKSGPDSRFVIGVDFSEQSIEEQGNCYQGLATADYPSYGRAYWEVPVLGDKWVYQHGTVSESSDFSGMENILLWEGGRGRLSQNPKAVIRGLTIHGNSKGVVVTQTRSLPVTRYTGNFFDNNVAIIVLEDDTYLDALWCYCASSEYNANVRKIDEKLGVTNATLAKVPFNKDKWKKIALEKYPNGLPQPYSNDPTQWIFHGHPCASVIWNEESKTTAIANLRQDDTVLQVAVARLLGYQWPAELDSEMELAPEMREVMKKNADFAGLIDDDGIVCIPAVRGEKTAAKRLEAILHKAYGEDWTTSVEQNLLKAVKAKDLESWLCDKFFDQHCKLFQHRPFIWQVWDGLKDGFSALVNYHKLDYKGLERLLYTYLDDWISTQKRDLADGKDGADIRLTAAENLKKQLEAILAGEKGLDIFVRWKPLEEQPIGWNPDLNDGVRLNIRPFMLAKDVGKKGAGVLRGKPNINWNKDRGTDVASAPWFDLGPVYGEKEGSRINDHHLTLAEKKAAREAKESSGV